MLYANKLKKNTYKNCVSNRFFQDESDAVFQKLFRSYERLDQRCQKKNSQNVSLKNSGQNVSFKKPFISQLPIKQISKNWWDLEAA
jgi:hypothetical protein